MTLLTTGDIADKLDVTRSLVAYLIDRDRIRPVGRAGNVRLFGVDEYLQIAPLVQAHKQRHQQEVGP